MGMVPGADQTIQEQAAQSRVPYWQERDATTQQHAHATARLRALLWLANHYPDTTAAIYQAQAGRLPLNPVDRTQTRRRALAWAKTLDRLGRLHPDDFKSRCRTELTRAVRLLGNGSRPEKT